MTPTSPRPDETRTSGNPATQAKINQTIKQQREQKRQEKLAEYQRQLAKRKRGKIVWWTVGSFVAVLVIGAIVASIVFAPAPPPSYEAGGTGATSRASRPSRTRRRTSRAPSTTRSRLPRAGRTTRSG